jgi:hypothetical protein
MATKRTASVALKKQKKKNNDDSLGELPEGLSDSEDSLLLPTKKKNNNNEEKKTPGGAKRKRKTASSSSSPTSSLKSGAISNSEGEDLTTDGKKRGVGGGFIARRGEDSSDDEEDAALKLFFSQHKDILEGKRRNDGNTPTTTTTSTRKRKTNGSAASPPGDDDENNGKGKRPSKKKNPLSFLERLQRNAEEREKEAEQNEIEEKMFAKHKEEKKKAEEEDELDELAQLEAKKTYEKILERENADKLHDEMDERTEPAGRMKTIASKALMKKAAAESEFGGYAEENFEEKSFQCFPDGPVCTAFMQRAKEMSEHMNLCEEFLVGRWLRYVEKSKVCNEPNAIFPWLLNVITYTSKNKEVVFAARDALIFALYEDERQKANGESIIGSWCGDNMDTLANTSFETLLVVAKSERAWKQKRRSGASGNSSTPIKKTNKKADDDVIVVLDVENNETTSLVETPNARISGTWSAQDALKALKKVGIDDSFPASKYDLVVKPPKLKGKRKKKKNSSKAKEFKAKVYEERPDVSVNVLGVVSAIRALCDYNYLQDEAPLTHAKSENFDVDGCAEIIKLFAKVRLDPRSDASSACFDTCVKSILRCVSSCNTIDAASKKQFSMKLSQKLANAVNNDSSSPAVTFILRWFPVHDAFSAFIRDGLALYGFRGCIKRIERGPPRMVKRQRDEDDSDDETDEEVEEDEPPPVDASLDIEAFRVSFECSYNLAARALVGDGLFSLRNPDFNNTDDIWQFVRLWDFADCVLNGGVSANTADAAKEGDAGLQKASKWMSKMKSLIPKQSRVEALALFRSRIAQAQNWYNQEAHARATGESIGGARVKFNEIEID